jgi:hypothetical protein
MVEFISIFVFVVLVSFAAGVFVCALFMLGNTRGVGLGGLKDMRNKGQISEAAFRGDGADGGGYQPSRPPPIPGEVKPVPKPPPCKYYSKVSPGRKYTSPCTVWVSDDIEIINHCGMQNCGPCNEHVYGLDCECQHCKSTEGEHHAK